MSQKEPAGEGQARRKYRRTKEERRAEAIVDCVIATLGAQGMARRSPRELMIAACTAALLHPMTD
jgi:hypothetical protein